MAVAVVILTLGALAALVAPCADAAGAPDITFVSQGGVVSTTYELNVSVAGEVDNGTVTWGFSDPPTFPMEGAGNGSFAADVPLGALKEGPQNIYVRAANLTGTAVTVHQTITVDNSPPTIELLSEGGHVTGEYVLIARVADAHLNTSGIECTLDGMPYGMELVPGSTDMYRFILDTTTVSEGEHVLQVLASDLANALYPEAGPNANASEELTVLVDNSDPEVHVTWHVPEYVVGDLDVEAMVTDLYLNESHVWVLVDGNDSAPFAMTQQGGKWRVTIDTASDLMCGSHTLVVEVADLAGHVVRSDEAEARVDNCAPMFEFTSATGRVMGVYNITVRVEDAFPSSAPIQAYFDGDVLDKVQMQMGTDGSYYYRLDTSNILDGDHTVTVTATDLAGHVGVSEPFTMCVDNNPPVFSDLSEGGNVSGVMLFSGKVTDAFLNSSDVWAVMYDESGKEVGRCEAIWVGDRFESSIDTHDFPDGPHALRLMACEVWGTCHESEPVHINIDNNPPYVMIVSKSGTVWGTYKLQVTVTDPNLESGSVKVRIGGGDPLSLNYNNNNKYWERNIDTTKLPEGDLTITVLASDTRGNVNATQSCVVRIENRADLEVVRIELERSEVAVGEFAKARVTVRNTGHMSANGFEVRLMAGTVMLDNTTEVLGLKAGTEKTYTLQWKVRGEGTQTIRALVDANNAVPETQEGNNGSQELNLRVTKDSPGPTALLAAVAVGSLAATLRRRRR